MNKRIMTISDLNKKPSINKNSVNKISANKISANKISANKNSSNMGSSRLKIIVDTREKFVFDHLNKFTYNYEISQVTIGDYAIVDTTNDKIIASIERKTYEDLAASIKDGRYQNKEKMISLREKTGCQLYYIIEGTAFPSETRRFGKIPYKVLESAIDHLSYRDKFIVIYTENVQHTIERINRLAGSLERLIIRDPSVLDKNIVVENKIIETKIIDGKSEETDNSSEIPTEIPTEIIPNIDLDISPELFSPDISPDIFTPDLFSGENIKLLFQIIIKYTKQNESLLRIINKLLIQIKTTKINNLPDDINHDTNNETNNEAILGSATSITSADLLKQTTEKTPADIAHLIFAQIRGISVESSRGILVKYSPFDILGNKFDFKEVCKIKHISNGRNISSVAIKELTNITPKIERKMLMCVPKISENTVSQLLYKRNLFTLINTPVEMIANFEVGIKTKKKLGMKLAQLIVDSFKYKCV